MAGIKQRVFFDTNVLVDVLVGPVRPSFSASAKLFQAARDGIIEAFITTQSVIDAEFISHRSPGREAADFRRKMLYIMSFVNVIHIDMLSIRDALKKADGDFEDEAQFIQADSEGMDVIVTSDRRFISAQNGVSPLFLSPEDFVGELQ